MPNQKIIPYGKQWIDENDINAVIEVLKGDWLTQGPKVEEFEKAIANYCNAKYAVAFSSGTSALHGAYFVLGIKEGDEVITTPLTFAATANAIVYCHGTPVFADIKPETLNIDPKEIEKKITSKTKAIAIVDFAGQPCDFDAIKSVAQKHNLPIMEDGAHALGSEYKDKKVGSLADLTVLSFHPVKTITSVTYDTPVLIKERGIIKLVKIGSLMDFMIDDYWEPTDYECLAFDVNGKISWQKIKAFIKHETHTEILRLNLEKGRKIEITKSHSVFTVRDGNIYAIEGRRLREGDYILAPRKLMPPIETMKEIDILDYIMGGDIKYNTEKIMLKKNIQGGGGGKKIKRKIKINQDFCKLLGYFAAEGSYIKNGGLVFTFGYKERNTFALEVKNIFEKIWPNFKANIINNPQKNRCSVVCGGQIHSELFRNLGCGKNVYSKAISSMIWVAGPKNQKAFIEGLLNGDGHKRVVNGSKSSKLKVASEDLANGLHYLLLMLGIQSRMEKGEYLSIKGKKLYFYVCEILGEEKQKTSRENCIPAQYVKLNADSSWVQSNRIRWKKSLSLATVRKWLNDKLIECPFFLLEDVALIKIKKIEKKNLHDFVYDFEVENLQNFIGGYGAVCLHNSGEGGMVLTNSEELANKMRVFRHHGIVKKPEKGPWYYEIEELGYNYRLTDIHCALGLSQFKKLSKFVARRREIVKKYQIGFSDIKEISLIKEENFVKSAWHIYPVQFDLTKLKISRKEIFEQLAEKGIKCQVHYVPVHLHPFYKNSFGYKKGDFPVAEKYYERAITLPLFPKMTDSEVNFVIKTVKEIINACKK